jgi:hypothetical protein
MLQPGRNMLVSGVLSDRASYDIQESRRSQKVPLALLYAY